MAANDGETVLENPMGFLVAIGCLTTDDCSIRIIDGITAEKVAACLLSRYPLTA
jgi:hypothetical protein